MVRWVKASNGEIPAGAVLGGRDHGCDIYVGRTNHAGCLLPGKVVPGYRSCFVPYDGKEHTYSSYEVLTDCKAIWVRTSKSRIVKGALQAGFTKDGEALFVGRVNHQGTLAVGKVHPSHGLCYISYEGAEHAYKEYEVLTVA